LVWLGSFSCVVGSGGSVGVSPALSMLIEYVEQHSPIGVLGRTGS